MQFAFESPVMDIQAVVSNRIDNQPFHPTPPKDQQYYKRNPECGIH